MVIKVQMIPVVNTVKPVTVFLIKSSYYQNSNSTLFFNSFKLHVWSITQKSDFMDSKSHFIDFVLKSLLFLYIKCTKKMCLQSNFSFNSGS